MGKRYGLKGLGKYPKRFKVPKDPLKGITNPAIRRLARRGGVKRISSSIYTDIRKVTEDKLNAVVGTIDMILEHCRRKTVTVADVQAALKREGINLYF